MSELTRIEDRFRDINPVPDESNPPMSVRSTAAAILALEERKVGMQQLTRPKDKHTQQRSTATRWLVAAATLVIVLVAIGAVALLGSSELEPADQPVATSAAPTTTAAPPTTEATTPTTPVDPAVEAQALEIAQAYAAAQSVDKRMALVADDAVFVDGGNEFNGRDEIRGWLEAMDGAGIIVEGSDFRVSGTEVTYRTRTGLAEGEGSISGTVTTITTLVIEDGLIQSLRRR